jgi:hypothetical protein
VHPLAPTLDDLDVAKMVASQTVEVPSAVESESVGSLGVHDYVRPISVRAGSSGLRSDHAIGSPSPRPSATPRERSAGTRVTPSAHGSTRR